MACYNNGYYVVAMSNHNELNYLFKEVVVKERKLGECKFRANKRLLRDDYKNARRKFDRIYRQKKKNHTCEQLENLENACETDPYKFWESIK